MSIQPPLDQPAWRTRLEEAARSTCRREERTMSTVTRAYAVRTPEFGSALPERELGAEMCELNDKS